MTTPNKNSEHDALPEPDDLAEEIAENLEAALLSFREIANGLESA